MDQAVPLAPPAPMGVGASRSPFQGPLFDAAPEEPFVLVVCAGPAWEGDAKAAARCVGVPVLLVDPLRGGEQHDITRPDVRAALRALCALPVELSSPCVVGAHFATPCRSFSPLNKWRGLRTRNDHVGARAPPEYMEYLRVENAIIEGAADLAHYRGLPR